MPETTKARKTPAKPRKTAVKAKTETAENKQDAIPHEEIRQLAHQYWVEGGHRWGHQHEDWTRAEAELRRRAS